MARVMTADGDAIDVLTPAELETWLNVWWAKASRKLFAWLVLSGLTISAGGAWAVKAWASDRVADTAAVRSAAETLRGDVDRIDGYGTRHGQQTDALLSQQLARLNAQMELVLKTLERIDRSTR